MPTPHDHATIDALARRVLYAGPTARIAAMRRLESYGRQAAAAAPALVQAIRGVRGPSELPAARAAAQALGAIGAVQGGAATTLYGAIAVHPADVQLRISCAVAHWSLVGPTDRTLAVLRDAIRSPVPEHGELVLRLIARQIVTPRVAGWRRALTLLVAATPSDELRQTA